MLLDAPETEMSAVVISEVDTEMHVDEEGRPRFAPAKNTVRNFL